MIDWNNIGVKREGRLGVQAARVPQAEEPTGTCRHLLIFRLHGGKRLSWDLWMQKGKRFWDNSTPGYARGKRSTLCIHVAPEKKEKKDKETKENVHVQLCVWPKLKVRKMFSSSGGFALPFVVACSDAGSLGFKNLQSSQPMCFTPRESFTLWHERDLQQLWTMKKWKQKKTKMKMSSVCQPCPICTSAKRNSLWSPLANHNLVPTWWTIPVVRDSLVLHGHTHVRGTMTGRPFNRFSRCKLPSWR